MQQLTMMGILEAMMNEGLLKDETRFDCSDLSVMLQMIAPLFVLK